MKISHGDGNEPQKRFQHTAIFHYNFLIVLGGKTFPESQKIFIEIFDTDSYKWVKTTSFFNIFRHTTFISNEILYVYGGFNLNNPNYALNDIIQIDLTEFFNNNDYLKNKLYESKNIAMKKKDNEEKILPNPKNKDSPTDKEKNIKQMMKIFMNQNKIQTKKKKM